MLERTFGLSSSGTNVRQEIFAGFTTFMTMSYIIFVQPAVMGAAGMDPGAVMVATCLASAIGTLAMAFLANYPIALAPAMGHNFFFTYTVVLILGYTWQEALGAVFIAGAVFILLSGVGFRERVMTSIPDTLRSSIPVGIGLLIALVGLEWSGIVVSHPSTYVALGDLSSTPALVSISGLIIMSVLFAKGFRWAIMAGIITTGIIALFSGLAEYHGIFAAPPSIEPTLFKLHIPNPLESTELITVIFIFLFLDIFDTVGTLIGVSQQGGLMKDGRLPRARQALLSDAIATCTGAILGTSTVTSYIESAAGITAGGKTGFSNVVTASLFVLAIFFNPIVEMIGSGFRTADGTTLYPVIAPALIIVGSMMFANISNIKWEDYTESIPAFLTLIMMPLAFSITEGISFGVIAYALLKLVSGRGKEVNWLIYIFAVLFVIRYILLV